MKLKDNSIKNIASVTLNRFKVSLKSKQANITKKSKIIMGAGALFLVAALVAFSINSSLSVYTISINGIEAGYIDKPSKVGKIIESIKDDYRDQSGSAEIGFDNSKIKIAKADVDKSDIALLSSGELKKFLAEKSLYSARSWVIKIDGENVVSASTEAAANEVIDTVKKSYIAKDSVLISAVFKQDVTVSNEMASLDLIKEPTEAASLILTGTATPKSYVVEDGDTMWDIAAKTNMKTAELISANPGFDPAKLKIGQTLNLFEKKPYVNVVTVEQAIENKAINFEIIYENTGALYKGEIKVKSPGVLGSEVSKLEVVKENGVWVSTKVLSSSIVSQPVNQVALKGTKPISTFTGTGDLNWPVSGAISSPFGSRGGDRHTGLDISASKGSPIVASDDGVVVFASYEGAYGNLMKLDHGKGVQTWYAHCSSFTASIGDVVRKGDVIASVGTTGRSTGYHLHFEVRINGVPVNPRNYL